MILLNNVTTNTIHFSDSVHPVSAQKPRADTSGMDVSFIIELTIPSMQTFFSDFEEC